MGGKILREADSDFPQQRRIVRACEHDRLLYQTMIEANERTADLMDRLDSICRTRDQLWDVHGRVGLSQQCEKALRRFP